MGYVSVTRLEDPNGAGTTDFLHVIYSVRFDIGHTISVFVLYLEAYFTFWNSKNKNRVLNISMTQEKGKTKHIFVHNKVNEF